MNKAILDAVHETAKGLHKEGDTFFEYQPVYRSEMR